MHEKAEIIWSKFRYMLVTFYNAVICSIIVWFWGGNISKLDRGRFENTVKKMQVMLWESHWTVLRLYTKRDCIEN